MVGEATDANIRIDIGEERVIFDVRGTGFVKETPAAGAGVGAGAGVAGATGATAADNAMMKQGVAAKQESAQASRQLAMADRQRSAALLGVNMSMLGVMFGMQNMINLAGMRQRQELMELQMKEKKSKADKERIKTLRKEQFEMQKWQARMNAGISLFMILMSVLQIMSIARARASTAAATHAAATLVEARAAQKSGNAAFFSAAGHASAQTAKAGPGAPVVAALIIAGLIAAVTAVVGVKALMAAKGGVINPIQGGQLFIGGEAGQTELITPVPMLKEIVREETRESLRETGGGMGGGVQVFTMDANTFLERRSEIAEDVRVRGQK